MARRAVDHGIAVREANLADIDRIVEIEDASFPDPYPRGLLKAFLYMPGAYMVATDGGTIVGYTIGIIRPDAGPPHRWRGSRQQEEGRQGAHRGGADQAGTRCQRFMLRPGSRRPR